MRPKHEVEYLKNGEILRFSLGENMSTLEWRKAHYEMLYMAEVIKPTRYLIEVEGTNVVAIRDQDFVAKEVFPKWVELGGGRLVYVAVVMDSGPLANFTRFAAKRIVKHPPRNIERKFCKNRSEALKWLRTEAQHHF